MTRHSPTSPALPLPLDGAADEYLPRAVPNFQPTRIVLARGSSTTPARIRFVEAVRRVYPAAEVIDRQDASHAQIDLGQSDPLGRLRAGKQTLVLGEHKSSVRFSDEQHNCCPNYWHFSPYGFCPYGCAYCYLAGTRGVWFSPTVKVFLNLDETLTQIDRIARQARRPTAFYLGKLQDGLALDPLTGFSRTIVPFFTAHPCARLILLTKSADVENLLPLSHGGNVVLSWSLASEGVWKHFEPGTPAPAQRLAAMRRCAQVGYRLRAVIMPILPISDWVDGYSALIDELLSTVPVERITLGSLCSFDTALRLTAARLGEANPLADLFRLTQKAPDGRRRFPRALREETYRHLLSMIHSRRPDLSPGLCLEDRSTFADLALLDSVGKCNCVL